MPEGDADGHEELSVSPDAAAEPDENPASGEGATVSDNAVFVTRGDTDDHEEISVPPDAAVEPDAADEGSASGEGAAASDNAASSDSTGHAGNASHTDLSDDAGNAVVVTEEDTDGNEDLSVLSAAAVKPNAVVESPDSEEVATVSGDDASPDSAGHAGNDPTTDVPDDTDAEGAEDAIVPGTAESAEYDDAATPAEPEGSEVRNVEDHEVMEDLELEHTDEHLASDRTEEVPALLGVVDISEMEEPDSVSDQDVPGEAVISPDGDDGGPEDEADETAFAADSADDLPDSRVLPVQEDVEPAAAAEHPAAGVEWKTILESLQDSLAHTHQDLSSKIEAVSNDTGGLIKQVNNVTSMYEVLASEMEAISSGANTKNVLSKTFLVLSSLIVALLVVFQIYMFTSLVKIQKKQNVAGASVLQNISSLNKKMAAYDKNITKALEKPVQPEPPPPSTAPVETAGHETHGTKEVAPAPVSLLPEKLNKLRNGLPEKKLLRKDTGDWYAFGKKSEGLISDAEVIEALNQAYTKYSRTLWPNIPLESQKIQCVLRPNGKGGTEIFMSRE